MLSESNPHMAAVVAAPILKLCVLKRSAGYPACAKVLDRTDWNWNLVRRDLSIWINKGPEETGRTSRNFSRALIGHNWLLAPLLMVIVVDLPLWSVLENLIRTCKAPSPGPANAMSDMAMARPEVSALFQVVNSPTRKNPKNVREKADLNNNVS